MFVDWQHISLGIERRSPKVRKSFLLHLSYLIKRIYWRSLCWSLTVFLLIISYNRSNVKCLPVNQRKLLVKHTEAYILRVQNSVLRVAHVKINVYCGSSIIRHLATRNQIKSHFKSSQLSFYNARIILVGDKSTIEQKAGSTKEEKNCKFTASENGR